LTDFNVVDESVVAVPQTDIAAAARQRRSERYELQAIAAQILARHPHPAGENSRWRVGICCKKPLPDGVKIMLTDVPGLDHPVGSYAGVQVCASVWTCAVCAARIAQRRAAEIAAATALHHAAGGRMLMLTLTIPHCSDDELQHLLGRRSASDRSGLRGAIHRLQNSRLWKGHRRRGQLVSGLAALYGYIGGIRALEVTLGANGWHPHVHILLLVGRELRTAERRDLEHELFVEWRRSCSAAGIREPNRQHGISLDPAWDASEYLSKLGYARSGWGPESELARNSTKRGRGTSLGPFDLLREFSSTGDCEPMEKFSTYATALFRAHHVHWRPGLKQAMGLADLSDEAIVTGTDEDARVSLEIGDYEWRCVLAQPPSVRAQILTLAERDGPRAVIDFLDSLRLVRY
jgi:hypothetical protein